MEDDDAQAGKQPAGRPSRGPWWRVLLWRTFLTFVIVAVVAVAGYAGLGWLYRGPQQMQDVVRVMPGVPLFPLTRVASANRFTQRGLAVPLALLRMQGAARAEAVGLSAPGDQDFVIEWYRLAAPSQGWSQVAQLPEQQGTRLLFLRGREGLHMLVGETQEILTPVQVIYISGMTARQRAQFVAQGKGVKMPPLPRLARPRPLVITVPAPPPEDTGEPAND